MRERDVDVAVAGHVAGVAADLAAGADLSVVPPDEGAPAGVPAYADAVVVDSYEVAADELAAAATQRPLCAVIDDGPPPPASAVLCYHLDADKHRRDIGGTPILGEVYAPVRPALFAARRRRELATALVTLGGSNAGQALVEPLTAALLGLDPELRVFVASSHRIALDDRVTSGVVRGGLVRQIAEADIAISGAGSTPYELACAGVPTLLVGLADNQLAVGEAFAEAGLAWFVDARAGLDPGALQAAVAVLGDSVRRDRMAGTGPARIDGYGAFRAADALLAAFAGRSLPRVIRFRPATIDDAGLLLQWRNDPGTRSASRERDEVDPETHGRWLASSLSNPDRTLLVASINDAPVGTVRFDRSGDVAEIGVSVAAEARGGGIGSQLIRETTELYLHAHDEVGSVRAEIRGDNGASLTAFERAGFIPCGATGDFEILEARTDHLRSQRRG